MNRRLVRRVWGGLLAASLALIVGALGFVSGRWHAQGAPRDAAPAGEAPVSGAMAPPGTAATAGATPPAPPSNPPAPQAGPDSPRGYLTPPAELREIGAKARRGDEPIAGHVAVVLEFAAEPWDFALRRVERCEDSNTPAWNDNDGGTRILYAKALAYHLTGNPGYAAEVSAALERIMTEVQAITLDEQQCRLNFAWGTPELVASADLIEDHWRGQECAGPTGTRYQDTTIGRGSCKTLFQNWLVKNPYYVVSLAADNSQSNWGAAATTTLAHIADYLSDRPEVTLIARRQPTPGQAQIEEVAQTPREAYSHANRLALDRMNGYRTELMSRFSCDLLAGEQQHERWAPVKSQITENGIIPEDARREMSCNVPSYNGEYQNYPQIHLGNLVQQCELMLRRGDSSCYDNVEWTDIPEYRYIGPDGKPRTTHLRAGRGSVERAIAAVIIDGGAEWRHDDALAVAYSYYVNNHRLPGIERWAAQIDRQTRCGQSICFGRLTHSSP